MLLSAVLEDDCFSLYNPERLFRHTRLTDIFVFTENATGGNWEVEGFCKLKYQLLPHRFF